LPRTPGAGAETSADAKNHLIAKRLTAPKALNHHAQDWFAAAQTFGLVIHALAAQVANRRI
jgi:hypothetical protein